MGALWSFGVRQPRGAPFLVLLAPLAGGQWIEAELAPDGRTVEVRHDRRRDLIRLPAPGSDRDLPQIERGEWKGEAPTTPAAPQADTEPPW